MLGWQRRLSLLELLIRRLPRVRAGAIAALAVGLLAAGCGDEPSSANQDKLPPPRPVEEPTPAERARPDKRVELDPFEAQGARGQGARPPRRVQRATSGGLLDAADQAAFERLEGQLGGQSGIALSALGYHQPVQQAGSLQRAIAWSTSKVPIAMAIIDAGLGPNHQADLAAAIGASDNAAAARLWDALGGGQAAAESATAQLRAAGDPNTVIESRTLVQGFSPFGQTLWTLGDQARFVAGMPCTAAGLQVLGLMHDVVSDQRWGLGAVGLPAELKGGWGPGSEPGQSGGYLDRQMGVVTVSGRPVALAIATLPADGAHATATSNLTTIARWAVEHLDVQHAPRTAQCR